MKSFRDWQREYNKEVAALERETDERIKQNNLRLDVELEMINASAQMRLDELLAGNSDEYRSGFLDGRIFEHETEQQVINA